MNASIRGGLPAQVVFGGLLLSIGLLLFLRNLGYLSGEAWRFWPLLFIAVGSLKLASATNPFDRLLGLGLLAFGALRIAATYLGLEVGVVDILATLLVIFGAAIAWRGIRGPAANESCRAEIARDHISAMAFMGGYGPKCTSQQFRGGDVSVLMGGIEMDLRQSSMSPQRPAVLDVFVMWGGVEVRVPDDWVVELRGTPILAGFEDKTRPIPGPIEKRLIVRGVAIMGGIEIKN